MSDRKPQNKLSVYLAGPITGATNDLMKNWRLIAKQSLSQICTFDDPTDRPVHVSDKLTTAEREKIGVTVVKDDYNGVNNSDVFLLNIVGASKISIGSMIELAWASMHNKPVVIVMDKGNVHEHDLLLNGECATFLTESLEEACKFIAMLNRGEVKVQNRAMMENNASVLNDLVGIVLSEKNELTVDVRNCKTVSVTAIFLLSIAHVMNVKSILYMNEGSIHDHAMLREIAGKIC